MAVKVKRKIAHPFVDELVEDEEIFWMGQPDTSKVFNIRDLYDVPFSLLWGGFALFWNVGVWTSNAPFFFRLWGLPFLFMGIYMIIGRFFYRWWRKRNTYYAVTDKRLLILTTGIQSNLQSFSLINLPELTKSVGRSGTGTITFGKSSARGGWQRSISSRSNLGMNDQTAPGFYDIPNANEVYALINDLSFSKEKR